MGIWGSENASRAARQLHAARRRDSSRRRMRSDVDRRIVHFLSARIAGLVALLAVAGHVLAFDLQGHRGARGLAPENTLPGFARALAIGVYRAEAWWQRLGRLAAVGSIPGFNATSFVWITKNRFGWKERVAFSSEQPLAVTLVDFSNALVPEPAPGAPDEPPP